MTDQLRIRAGALCFSTTANGILGSNRIALAEDHGVHLLQLQLVPEINWLQPGDKVIVTLGLVSVSLGPVEPPLPGKVKLIGKAN